jgi:class 3 adenylate cyclase/tetratricopeptide (TPR) repeat protein
MAIDVAQWLRGLGLAQYEEAFRKNAIDARVVPELTADDLKELGVAAVGDRRLLLNAIAALRTGDGAAVKGAPPLLARSAEAERRVLTVMFCDLVGSTSLSARLDPEDLREVIAAYHGAVAATVARFGGVVAKYMGDGVLIYFGYPEAHEDDVEQSVRAGLAIIDAVARLGPANDLAVRIGIATGLVVVGDLIGEGASQEQAVVGETPNLAARLQALAEPGTIVIADGTRRVIGHLFEFDDLGPQELRGFPGRPRAWRVVSDSQEVDRFAALGSEAAPMVGREEELDILLRRWSQASAGQGRVVLLSGEPGIGKSRLTAALRSRLSNTPHTRLRYFCSPQQRDSALYPVIAQLERASGFARDDPPEVRLDKLATMLGESTPLDDVSLIAEMLSLPGGDRFPPLALSPPVKKERTLVALVRQLESLAARQPVLMIFEDLHWIDPTSREVLDIVVERIANLRVLLILTHRPEFQPAWVGLSQVTPVALGRLARSEGADLVRSLAGNGAALQLDVVNEIVERTDGIPLFVEELTKAVLEAGTARGEAVLAAAPEVSIAVPATLHASLLARLDRLGPAAKQAAQMGAAIGRDFSFELLAAVSQLGETELQDALRRLVESGLVFQRGTPPTAEYLFKHALVQDIAYSTLLRGPRRNLHQRIAEALEQRFPETTETQPEIVARHYTDAGLTAPAINYWRKAGERALQRSANAEASAHLRAAIDLIAALPVDGELRRKELDLQMALGSATRAIRGHASDETLRVYSRARELLDERVSVKDQIGVLYGLWSVNVVRCEYLAGLDTAKQSLAVAERHQEPEASAFANRMMGLTLWATGRFREAAPHLRQAVALYAPGRGNVTDLRYSQDHAVWAQMMLALTLWPLGYPQQAASAATQSIAWARTIGHAMTTGFALAFGSILNAFLNLDRSGDGPFSEQALRYCLEQDLRAYQPWTEFYHGLTLLRQGEHTAGLEAMLAGMDRAEKINMNMVRALHLGYVASARAAANRFEAALEGFDEAFAIVERTEERMFEAELHRMHSEVLVRAGCVAQAEEALSRALTVARGQQARMWELRAATSLARLWIEQGKRQEARDLLAPVWGWFTEGFDTADLQAARSVLDAPA